VFGFTDRSPASSLTKDGDDVVVIVRDGLEIENERGVAREAQRDGGEHRTFHAVGFPFTQYHPW
jgi:hypothetical protein